MCGVGEFRDGNVCGVGEFRDGNVCGVGESEGTTGAGLEIRNGDNRVRTDPVRVSLMSNLVTLFGVLTVVLIYY